MRPRPTGRKKAPPGPGGRWPAAASGCCSPPRSTTHATHRPAHLAASTGPSGGRPSCGRSTSRSPAHHRQHKIRIDGIDAPESGQPFGRASKHHLAELVANRQAVAECSKIDQYRREVCQVRVGGADAGLEQIRAGTAWYFRRYANELPPDRRQQYADMEAQARAAQLGLWADAEPVPPWDWRARRDQPMQKVMR